MMCLCTFKKEIHELLNENIEKCGCEECLNSDDLEDQVDRKLIWLGKHGNSRAYELFVLDKTEYVRKIISCDRDIAIYKKRGLEDDDLFQTGIIGVIYTVHKFDFRPNIKVRTFLTNNIKYSIMNAFRKYGSLSVSREAVSIYSKCSNYADLLGDRIAEKTLQELSKLTKIEIKKIIESILAVKNRNCIFSINNDGCFDGDNVSIEKFGMKRVCEFEKKMDEYFDYRVVLDAIERLGEREKYIMKSIYIEDRTQKDLAVELNCSVTAIGKIKKKAIDRIRHNIKDEFGEMNKY